MSASGLVRSVRRAALLMCAILAPEASALGWQPVWSTTVEPVPGRTFLRGACVRGGTLYVTAVVTTPEITDPTPVLYSLASGEANPVAKRRWQGAVAIGPEIGLSNPSCGPDGVSFVVRESAKPAAELVRLSDDGGVARRKLTGLPVVELTAFRLRAPDQWLLGAGPSARLFEVRADGQTREIAVEGAVEGERVVDLCVSADRSVVLLTSAEPDRPVGILKLRKWSAELEGQGSRELRASFGGLVCAPSGEVDVLHLQPQGAGAASWVLARFGPGLSGPRTRVVEAAAIASMSANGLWDQGSAYWAVTNYKAPTLYETPDDGPRLVWRDDDERFGGTTTAPAVIALDAGSLTLVYEAYDRSATGLPVVLRAVRLKR